MSYKQERERVTRVIGSKTVEAQCSQGKNWKGVRKIQAAHTEEEEEKES